MRTVASGASSPLRWLTLLGQGLLTLLFVLLLVALGLSSATRATQERSRPTAWCNSGRS